MCTKGLLDWYMIESEQSNSDWRTGVAENPQSDLEGLLDSWRAASLQFTFGSQRKCSNNGSSSSRVDELANESENICKRQTLFFLFLSRLPLGGAAFIRVGLSSSDYLIKTIPHGYSLPLACQLISDYVMLTTKIHHHMLRFEYRSYTPKALFFLLSIVWGVSALRRRRLLHFRISEGTGRRGRELGCLQKVRRSRGCPVYLYTSLPCFSCLGLCVTLNGDQGQLTAIFCMLQLILVFHFIKDMSRVFLLFEFQ